eukprot:m.31137 g.31137  ORF g.31137 m.31137 type:complete len:75 (-) comp13949_c0_seq2:210-434(-)
MPPACRAVPEVPTKPPIVCRTIDVAAFPQASVRQHLEGAARENATTRLTAGLASPVAVISKILSIRNVKCLTML